MTELRELALHALCQTTSQAKAAVLEGVAPDSPIDSERTLVPQSAIPGRPPVELVPPSGLRLRSVHTLEGRAILIHALAHIEFNAINLALDIVWRFAGMPADFYRQWFEVAKEEALHFSLLNQHLQTLGYQYGDFPAHDGLWEMSERTQEDVLALYKPR